MELAEEHPHLGMLALDDEAGLVAVALCLHQAALDGGADARLERVALDAREELGEERLVHPVDALAVGLRAADEVEEVDDAGRLVPRVLDERVLVREPAHRDLFAVALD